MGYFFSFTQIIVWVNVWSYLARFGARGFLDVHHRNKPMNTIVVVVRILVLSLTLAFVGAFAALATGTAAPAAETAHSFVSNIRDNFTDVEYNSSSFVSVVNYQWLDMEERAAMGDSNLVDGLVTQILVHQTNIEGTIVYETLFVLCDLETGLYDLSQQLYADQFTLMGWFGL
jgi:hypothetical protein